MTTAAITPAIRYLSVPPMGCCHGSDCMSVVVVIEVVVATVGFLAIGPTIGSGGTAKETVQECEFVKGVIGSHIPFARMKGSS